MSHVCVAASAVPARVAWEAPTLYIAEAAWLHAALHGPVCSPYVSSGVAGWAREPSSLLNYHFIASCIE